MDIYLEITLASAGDECRLTYSMNDLNPNTGSDNLFRISKRIPIKPAQSTDQIQPWIAQAMTMITDEIMHATYTTRIVPDVQWRKDPPAPPK